MIKIVSFDISNGLIPIQNAYSNLLASCQLIHLLKLVNKIHCFYTLQVFLPLLLSKTLCFACSLSPFFIQFSQKSQLFLDSASIKQEVGRVPMTISCDYGRSY